MGTRRRRAHSTATMSAASFTVKPVMQVTRQFASLGNTFTKKAAAAPAKVDTTVQSIHGKSGRKCMLTGKKANNGWTVSFSHIRNKKLQGVNLQFKRVYWPEKQRYVRLRISTKALKTINKLGLEVMAERAGLDLESLPYTDGNQGVRGALGHGGGVIRSSTRSDREP